ncbi:MAG: UDP-N-acetylmuramoyl-L-alanine--D-glutamate ligase [Deltaproteobacteria bacterium]|nr:MAG: UDP-N-acetylmuramoyl-L-alanine--D-glutamate ligase [Deltaproteobacteria bacterium]
MRLAGRRALVVGLGKSGVAAARLLATHGARVAVADDKGEGELGDSLRQLDGVPHERHLGGLREDAFRGRDLVVVSPGVPLSAPPIAEARSRGVEVIGEVELAARFIEEPIAGITGTNGKSTTTALTAHLLRAAGKKVFAGGNLGDALSNRVLSGGKLDATVCELSSYQLEGIVSLRCAAAAALNVTPDHLDRYPSLEAYAAAKERIFANQKAGDAAVLNLADPRVAAMRTPEGVRRRGFDPRGRNAEAAGFLRAKSVLAVDGAEYDLRAPTLRGAHNAENALAALLLARHLGAPPWALQQGLDTYPGLPHRLEPVRTLDGVEWVNDSKGTNVDSVEKSLSAFDGGVLLIMGGRGKGAPYRPLRALFPGRVRALLTIGEDALRIAEELGDLAPVTACGDLRTAVAQARKLARAGDAVLLSPACASYDQFRNFEDRGEQFKALVRGLS